jgi:hypothetical protein
VTTSDTVRALLRAGAALVLLVGGVVVAGLLPDAITRESAVTWLQWSVAAGVLVQLVVIAANLVGPRRRDRMRELALAAVYLGAAVVVSLVLGAIYFVVDGVAAGDAPFLAALVAIPPAFGVALALMSRQDGA